MNFKKRVNGSWTNTLHYIHKTDTDTITTLPTVIYPTGTTATVRLKGQTLQSSTPSPTSPVMPEGCGDLETSGAKAGQYKIPISSANTTTPVYLGEVETTRKIKKYIFNGTEQWQRTANGAYFLASSVTPITDFWHDLAITSVNSHFAAQENVTGSSSVADNKSAFYGGSALATKEYYIAARDIADVTDFKAFLAAQYAAGTPVTVWYVLATPETTVVNEPLMRIGDYADTLSGISIPVTAGGDTLSVGTTVQPSEVTVNYKGWHPVADVHERESGQWD